MTISLEIKLKWSIRGIDGYMFGEDKCLYNIRTSRKLKQSLNND